MTVKKLLAFFVVTLAFISEVTAQDINVIPRPASVECRVGSFDIAGASFYVDKACDAVYAVEKLASDVSTGSGKRCKMVSRPVRHSVRFITDASFGEEEYAISVNHKRIEVKASMRRGFLYAIQTLRQLIPLHGWTVACVEIRDSPQFAYRGVHLDCARHFFTVEQIKEYLDILSIYKVNHFHWHLTDDHAWRLEIKRYPLLTEVGAHNCGAVLEADPKVKGEILYDGFYTQSQAREIVSYADSLGITVVPEIDMPSHFTAGLAAYPFLGCTQGPYEVIRVVGPRGKGLAKDALCVGRESTFDFIENVLDEVLEIFPSELIHIGGDECIKDRWYECPYCQGRIQEEGIVSDSTYTSGQYLQVYFVNRIQKYLNSKGRRIIGWDEILDGKLDSGAVVMSWRGVRTGLEASRRGFDVIMSPVQHCYLDYRQSRDLQREPRAFAGTVTIEDVYGFNPLEGLDSDAASHIMGVQGNLWTDVIGVWSQVEYMLLPRLAALSEVQWCSPARKDYNVFRKAMNYHAGIYDARGYVYARHLWGVVGIVEKTD